jgi:hypothetical protein
MALDSLLQLDIATNTAVVSKYYYKEKKYSWHVPYSSVHVTAPSQLPMQVGGLRVPARGENRVRARLTRHRRNRISNQDTYLTRHASDQAVQAGAWGTCTDDCYVLCS